VLEVFSRKKAVQDCLQNLARGIDNLLNIRLIDPIELHEHPERGTGP
jgi:hypothetical protein